MKTPTYLRLIRYELAPLLLLVILNAPVGFAQISFKGHVLDKETQRGIPKLGISLVGQGSGTTDSDGYFDIPIGEEVVSVEVSIQSDGWEIVEPSGSLSVPRDENFRSKIWLKARNPQFLIEEYNRLKDSLSAIRMDTVRLRASIRQLENQVKNTEDRSYESQRRLIALRDSLNQYKKNLGTIDRKINENRLRLYENISQQLLAFTDAILNFRVELENISDVFINVEALRHFNQQIGTLNTARDQLHQGRQSLEMEVETYWDIYLAKELSEVYAYALDVTYDKTIIPLNKALIAEIDASWNGAKSRMGAQRKAKKKAKAALNQLVGHLDYLIPKMKDTLQSLKVIDR